MRALKNAPVIFLLITLLGLALVIENGYPGLPETVASHFNGRCGANGWMKKKEFLLFILLMAHLVPLIITATLYSVRFAPASMLNLPHKEYWTQEGNRKHLNDYLFNSSLWLAGGHILFFAELFRLVSDANQHNPAYLSPSALLTMTLVYTVVILGWTIALIMWLTKKPTA